jgi:hypothetical protein
MIFSMATMKRLSEFPFDGQGDAAQQIDPAFVE